jgi:hypothetical protein
MCGSPVTCGLFRSRSSFSASGTMKMSRCWMACVQNEIDRGVCAVVNPILALNHWRSSSTSEIAAIGVSQMCEASSARSSKAISGSVSRMWYFLNVWRRASSLVCSSMRLTRQAHC